MSRDTLPWLLAAGVVATAGTHGLAASAAAPTEGRTMYPYPHLYDFVQAGLSIGLARIERVQHRPGPGSEEIVELELRIVEPWWRPPADTGPLHYTFRQPVAVHARLKFPHPLWGRVVLETGALLLLAYKPGVRDPAYVDAVRDADAPPVVAARALLAAERQTGDADGRFERRLAQLRGLPLERLFAGEALAHHRGAFSPDQQERLAEAFALAYAEERDAYVKVSLGSWLWEPLYRKFSRAGRTRVLNATLASAAAGPEGMVRTQALDRLARAEPAQLRERDIVAAPAVVALLEQRLATEDDAGVKRRLQEVIEALRR